MEKYTARTWMFIKLTEKGKALAREAYLKRLNDKVEIIKKTIEKGKELIPIILYGLRFDRETGRVYVPATYEDLGWLQKDPSIHHVLSTLKMKTSTKPEEPRQRRTVHPIGELWEMAKQEMSGGRIDILRMFFRVISAKRSLTMKINELFRPLHENAIVSLLPWVVTSRIYFDRELWMLTDELLEMMSKYTTPLDMSKIEGLIARFLGILLTYFGMSTSRTKGDSLKIADIILRENPNLGLSLTDLTTEFANTVDEINARYGCISKFNYAGGDDSRPFIIFDQESLNKALDEMLEELAIRTLEAISEE